MADIQPLLDQAGRVQQLLLEDFERILSPVVDPKTGKTTTLCSPTDRATIARFLKDNNYNVDARTLPKDLVAIIKNVRTVRQLPDAAAMPTDGATIE